MARGRRGRPRQNVQPKTTPLVNSSGHQANSEPTEATDEYPVLGNPNFGPVGERVPSNVQNQRRPTTTYAAMVNPDEGLALKFVEASVINGTKCAKIEHQDVAAEIEYWNQVVICCVLGANPPLGVINGYVRRIWSRYEIDKVVAAHKGIYLGIGYPLTCGKDPPLMDSILSWNIRGLNGPNKQEDLKIFLQNNSIGLADFLETKVKRENVNKVVNNLCQGWDWHSNIQSSEKDRIWILWRPNCYAVTIVATTNQMVHCKAIQLSTQKKFHLTIVYGFNKEELRRPLWNDLKDISQQSLGAWPPRVKMYQLAEVLKSLRKPLKHLNNTRFKDVYQQLDITREKLENIQMRLHQDYHNSQLQEQEKEARDRYLDILDSALKLMHQQSKIGKIEWSNKGDQCSRLFFAKMNQRKQADYIYSITNAQGQEARGFAEIANVLSDFY
ncbi:hypothetical protein Cgig2_010627 [Carnegiea gigantea]|uniref:Uncharacterized protein n=1 Tax=Carnegiea gigantea TaxID=171969 RepID=A0A9Q1GUW9_9CARY|nr:hypothetical protein Cgig2_010627 [Carnegiea gigantea]